MGKIHELDRVLADQIAAGEVIERPASIVKELVENSIDAHSNRVDIIVEEAGLKEIRIIDNGDGIAADDLAIAFRRHATSKIQNQQDLFRVQTMGFRGEALPSIASVADVTMTTSTGDGAGNLIHLKGGEVLQQQAASARPGTDITVKDLFYNTPARLKYLKSPRTELSRIVDLVNRLALSEPNIAFSLSHNGRELFRSAGNGNLQQVIAAIYGNPVGEKMLPVAAEDPDFKISGYLSLPELTRSSRQYMTVTINHRYIYNFQLTKAIIAGYGSKLMVGRYPIVVLDIELDPLLVDVNVHPAKREVRLSKEGQLENLICSAIEQVGSQTNLIPDVGHRAAELVGVQTPVTMVHEATTPVAEPITPNPSIIISSRDDLASPAVQEFDQRYEGQAEDQPQTTIRTQVEQTEEIKLAIEDHGEPQTERFPDLTYLGQLHGTYLLAQASDGLYIVDQHAAQERINYEHYRQAIGEVSDDQQTFLEPLVLNFSLADALKIQDHLDVLRSVGIYLEAFGQNSFMLASHPTWFVAGQEEATAREMIDWVIQTGHLTVAQFREKTAIMMSCKRAIKANHYLNDQQAKALLARLPECENPFNCPHGRPVTIHFSPSDLEKLFKRIQDSHQPFADEFDDHI